jgi:glycosyltransferase involved in cell wall biosynthesis
MAEKTGFDTSPLRILHIFSRLNCGGAEKRTLEVAQYIHRHPELGQRIQSDYCVLSGQRGELDEEAQALGGTVHYLPLRKSGFSKRFVALLRERRYDVVHSHVHYPSGILLALARLAGTPNRIAHFRSQSDGKRNLLRKPFRWLMKRLIDRSATHILGVSRCVMDAVWGPHWFCDKRCQVIYNGIDLGDAMDFESGEGRARLLASLGLPSDTRLIIHVGSYRRAKNHKRLIEIFHQVHQQSPQSHLLLIGDLSAGRDQLTRQIAGYDLEKAVHFLGLQKNVPQLLRSADLMIFPSLWEGLPGAILESLAMGIPVVASDIPPHREIAGWLPGVTLVPLNVSDEQWARRVNSLRCPTSQTRAEAWRAFTESPFSLEQSVASLIAVWQERDSSMDRPSLSHRRSIGDQSIAKGRAA